MFHYPRESILFSCQRQFSQCVAVHSSWNTYLEIWKIEMMAWCEREKHPTTANDNDEKLPLHIRLMSERLVYGWFGVSVSGSKEPTENTWKMRPIEFLCVFSTFVTTVPDLWTEAGGSSGQRCVRRGGVHHKVLAYLEPCKICLWAHQEIR